MPTDTGAKNRPAYPALQRGMCYVTWSENKYGTEKSDESIRSMSEAGVDCVSIVVTWHQEEHDSIDIKRTDKTPTDESLMRAIRKAHECGMAVMVKPHIDLLKQTGTWRGDIGFSNNKDWDLWFKNYERFITHYAKLAEKENVEYLCIGTELSFAADQTGYWTDCIIPAVKKCFSGLITYAANWDNYMNIGFWDKLDYVGIDAYFPLSKKDDPTLEELKEGWKKWAADIERFQKKVGKPVLFTEIGYCSAAASPKRPWEVAMSGKVNVETQAKCYAAFFETFWEKPWFYGAYWWNWNTYAGSGGKNNRGYTPQNKPALNFVRMWYGYDREQAGMAMPSEARISEMLMKEIPVTAPLPFASPASNPAQRATLAPSRREPESAEE